MMFRDASRPFGAEVYLARHVVDSIGLDKLAGLGLHRVPDRPVRFVPRTPPVPVNRAQRRAANRRR